MGQAFRQGDVPNGSVVRADFPNLQCVIKNRWPDGSAKFAILSGRTDLGANTWRQVVMSVGAAPTASANVSLADFKSGSVSASIAYGSYGAASWTGADWDSPAQTWVEGPEMSSWIYRKPIGSDAHLVAWMEVRAYRGGRIEVLPWIENGYLNKAGPGERSGTASFTLAGTQRFSQALNLLNHQRAVLASGTTLTHWAGGADPQLTPKYDTAYLMSTKLVPNYRGAPAPTSPLFGRLPTSYTPLAQASYPTTMGTTGYHPSIGLLPEWDVAVLVSASDQRAYRGALINGYSAGRYGVHYRDEATQRPLRMSSYPNLVMGAGSGVTDVGGSSTGSYTPAASGGSPPQFKISHHPSMGYMAYLISGWNYFMEETQLLATSNFLKQSDTVRGKSKGLLESSSGTNTVRGAAWAMRTLAQAATVTPDADPLHADFVTSVNENIGYYHGRYVAITHNPQGLVEPYTDYTPGDPYDHQIWMDDFFTAAVGFMKDTQVASTTVVPKLDQFLAWKYKAIIGRLGGSGTDAFTYREAAQYLVNYSPSRADWSGGTGPWYASWGAIARSMSLPTDGTLGATLDSGYPDDATAYWGPIMPAISYAVDHGAAGAAASWNRIVSASNFSTLAAAFSNDPVWGMKPR